MSTQSHIEVIDRLHRGLESGTADPSDVDGMVQDFDTIYTQANADVCGQLARLRQVVVRHVDQSQTTTSVSRESLQKLRDEMDRRFVSKDNPEGGVGNLIQAGLNRFTLFERENLPSDPRLNAAASYTLRTGIITGGVAVVGGAAYISWKYLFKPVFDALGSIGTTVVGIGTSVGATVAAFSWMPQSWRDGIRAALPEPLAKLFASNQSQQKLSAEQMKKLEDQRQNQASLTDNAVREANDRITNTNPVPPAQEALKQIAAEMTLIQSLTQISSLPTDRRTLLTERRTTLENARRQMLIITRETPAEILQDVTRIIAALPNNPNLLNPQTEREVAGVRVRFSGNSIFLNDRRLVIEATRYGSPWCPVTLNTLTKSGANLQATATATLLGFPINRTPVFTSAKIAEALTRYKNGELPSEEDETDADNRPTGVRLKFSLAS